jgi:TRAP transporter TAXI family solute receptor
MLFASGSAAAQLTAVRPFRRVIASVALVAGMIAPGAAQTYGIATMQPGTLNHTTGSAIAKVLKEKGGLNVLVQPTAGETTLIPMVGRGEAELGIANIHEVLKATQGDTAGKQPDLRLIGTIHPLRVAFFVRKDSTMKTMADLRGKKVTTGYSAMRTIDPLIRAILITGGLTDKDILPVPVPNVIRGADEFLSGGTDMFFFAFGAAKVREVDASVGGIRALQVPAAGMDAANKIAPYGYLTKGTPSPFFVGVSEPTDVYTYDNMLFTNAKVKDEMVYKIIETLENNKADLVAVQPALRDFSAAKLHKKFDLPYHAGALKYFKDKNLPAQAIQ